MYKIAFHYNKCTNGKRNSSDASNVTNAAYSGWPPTLTMPDAVVVERVVMEEKWAILGNWLK